MRRRAVLAGCLLLAIAGFLAVKILISPDIPFLRPGFQGTWIAHPDPPIDFHPRDDSPSPDMVFRHRFRAAAGASLPIRVTALQSFALTINGTLVRHRPPATWKRWTAFELGPYLRAGSENELSLWVENPEGPPALLIEGPPEARSGAGWTVSLGPDFTAESPAVQALAGEWYMADRPNPLRRSPLFPLYLAGLILLLAFIVYAALPGIPRRLAPSPPAPTPSRRFVFLQRHGVCLLILLTAAVWQIHNARTFEPEGCDRRGHVAYIQMLAEKMARGNWTLPTARHGWQTFQPPLYYVLSASVYRWLGGDERADEALRGVQIASAAVCLLIPFFAWLALCRLFPDSQRARNLGLAVTAILPLPFSHSPVISNEGFAAAVISGTILLTIWLAGRERVHWAQAVLLGAACAAGLMAKYTGLFVFASVAAALSLRQGRQGWRAQRTAALAIAVALALCGWYYARNVQLFGRVFVMSQDLPRYAFYQVPAYHDFAFLTHFGRSLVQEPEKAAFEGYWDGTFASLWADAQSCGFLDPQTPGVLRLEAVTLWLALVPAAAIVLGFALAVRRLLREGFDHPFFVPVLTTVTTITGVVLFTLEQPVFSAVKSWYLWSLLVPAALYAALGLERMSRQLGRLRFLLYAHLTALSGLVLYLYWYA